MKKKLAIILILLSMCGCNNRQNEVQKNYQRDILLFNKAVIIFKNSTKSSYFNPFVSIEFDDLRDNEAFKTCDDHKTGVEFKVDENKKIMIIKIRCDDEKKNYYYNSFEKNATPYLIEDAD